MNTHIAFGPLNLGSPSGEASSLTKNHITIKRDENHRTGVCQFKWRCPDHSVCHKCFKTIHVLALLPSHCSGLTTFASFVIVMFSAFVGNKIFVLIPNSSVITFHKWCSDGELFREEVTMSGDYAFGDEKNSWP